MKRVTAWMLAAGMLAGLLAGCQDKTPEPVAKAPPQEQLLPLFPEDQVPAPEPQPPAESASPSAKTHAPPVDTTATAAENAPAASAQPLPKESYAPVRPQATRTYVVKKGDNLYKISRKFFGTGAKWRAIYQANRDVLTKGPDVLPVGTKLKIP